MLVKSFGRRMSTMRGADIFEEVEVKMAFHFIES